MGFNTPEIAKNACGGTELVTQGLIKGLQDAGRQDLLDFFEFYPSRIENFNPDKPSVYVVHDLVGDPCFEHLWQDNGRRFDMMVFVSDWQHQQFLQGYRLRGHNTHVIPNGFIPFGDSNKWDADLGTKENPIRLIYHTTPHRGLQLLVPAYKAIYDEFRQHNIHIHLDVYSSFKIYGWEERDREYSALFAEIKNHPGMAYHGSVSNLHVRKALQQAHVFALPSIWPETFCLALVEAMSAQAVCVHSNLGALPNTSGGFSISYPFSSDNDVHLQRFYQTLRDTLLVIAQAKQDILLMPMLASQRANVLYGWDAVIPQWINLLDSAKKKAEAPVD